MIKTRYVDADSVNRLIHAIGIQAKRDYIDARAAMKRGYVSFGGKPAHVMCREIEEFIRAVLDQESAEYWIRQLKNLKPEDRDIDVTMPDAHLPRGRR